MQSGQKLHIDNASADRLQRKRSPRRHSIRAFNLAPLDEMVQTGERLSLQRRASAERRPSSAPRRSRRAARIGEADGAPRRERALRAAQEAMAAVQEHPINYASLSQLAQLRSIYEQARSPEPALKLTAPDQSEWVSEAEIKQERSHALQSQSLSLTETTAAPALARLVRARSPSRLARLKSLIDTFVRRLIAFLFPQQAPRRTARGQAALAQLQALAGLLRAEFDGSGMDLVQYQVAFGQAYYDVLTASRNHYKRHRGTQEEDYEPYFKDFLRQMP